MKLFDYKCPRCGHADEVLLDRGESDPACPVCTVPMERQLSVPGAPVIRQGDGRSTKLGEAQVLKTKDWTYTVRNVEQR